MECWWAQPLSHDGSVHAHSRTRLVRGMQLMAASCRLGLRGDVGFVGYLWGCLRSKSTRRDSKKQSHLPEGSYCHG